MAKLSKKARAYRLFKSNLGLFFCPLCNTEFSAGGNFNFHCVNGHNFDLARNGYLNLLTVAQREYYQKDLFSARRKVFQAGLFDPLIKQLDLLIKPRIKKGPLKVLDAGCGEGSLLVRMANWGGKAEFLGVDISKDAVRLAGGYPEEIMWCVADLAALPFRANSIDVILNVLSPANYGEFQRVLQQGGLVIKVMPGPEHLQEIRTRLTDVAEHSNEAVLENFTRNFSVCNQIPIRYQMTLNQELWLAVVEMTPLTVKRSVEGGAAPKITIDLQVVSGELKG